MAPGSASADVLLWPIAKFSQRISLGSASESGPASDVGTLRDDQDFPEWEVINFGELQ